MAVRILFKSSFLSTTHTFMSKAHTKKFTIVGYVCEYKELHMY